MSRPEDLQIFCVITSEDGSEIQEIISINSKKTVSSIKTAITRIMKKRGFTPSQLFDDVKGKWHWLRSNPNWVLRRKEVKIFHNYQGDTLRTYIVPEYHKYALIGYNIITEKEATNAN